MAATQTQQSQGGSDASRQTHGETVVTSTREQPQQVTTTESAGSTQTTKQTGSASKSIIRHRIGCTVSFTIKVLGNLPPSK